jgi:restriction endonuclease S subunit
MNVPRLRFKEFSGEWKETLVLDFAPLQRGFDLPVSTIVNGKFPVVFSNGILKHHHEYKAAAPGVVTGRSGTIGNVTYVEENYWPHNTSLWVTDFKNNFPKFVYYFYIKFDLARFGTGSGVPTLNRNDVHSQKVFIPTLPEQTKIANFLTAVDEKIAQLTQKVDLLALYKKGVMQQIFSQQLRFKDDDGLEFPEWEEKSLGEIATNHYQGINTTADKVKYENIGFPIIQAKHITNEFLDFYDAKKVSELEYYRYKEKYNPKKYDLLISNIGTLGKIVLVNDNIDFLIAWNIFKVTLNLAICDPQYVTHYLKQISHAGYFESIKTGNATKFINKSEMLAINIIFPTISEQAKIANFLTALDEKISHNQTRLNAMKQYKQGLLQQMFS